MDDLRLHAYYYSFAPTGQREVDLILHAVARAGKAFHHTSQWADDEMEGFYEHCEGDTCEQWIQNAANKAAAELATLRARVAELERDAALVAVKAMHKLLDRDWAIVDRDITLRCESHDQAWNYLHEMRDLVRAALGER